MHQICAILLPDKGEPEDLLAQAEEIIGSVADENNWFSLIGLIRADGTIVSAHDPYARWSIEDLAKEHSSREEWLDFVRELVLSEMTYVMDASEDEIRRMVDEDGKEALIKALAAVVVDEEAEPWERNLAALQAAQVVQDDWPYQTQLTNWYIQRVYKSWDVDPQDAAIVLADIHT